MPANDHLQWFEITDFSAGIWDEDAIKGRFAAPPNAFRLMTNYMPIKPGGVRAAFQGTAISTSGIGANEVITGIWARNGVFRSVANGGTNTDSVDMVVVTKNTSDFKWRVYRRDGTVASPSWSLRSTSAASTGAGHQITDMVFFKDSNAVEWLIISVFSVGILSMRFDFATTSNTGNDGLVATLNASISGPVIVSQARIMAGGGNDDKLYYSNVGLTTGLSTLTFLQVAPNRQESNISILSGVEPSDILIGKEGAPWVVINGDILSAPVREMGDDHHQRQDKQQVPRVPGGIAFIEGNGRVFLTQDGRVFQSISDQLRQFPLVVSPSQVGPGTMAHLNGYLFAPGPSGFVNVFDFDIGAWHRLDDMTFVFGAADPYGGKIWCADHSTSPVIYGFTVMGDGARHTSGILQTVPFADKNGRNLDIREVQIFANCYDETTNTFKVELIDEEGFTVATRYATVAEDRAEMVRFLFPSTKSEYLSVKITTSTAGAEAPTIERIRVAFGINNIIA